MLLKVAPVFLLALVVSAEKKIELQDIENDNLKSEKEKDFDKNEARSQTDSNPGILPLDFFKNGFLRYLESPTQAPQQRYVQQYAVTEPPERPPPVTPKPQYGPPPPTAQQAMVGYYSNVPMQIYLVPQYYSEPSDEAASHQPVQYSAPAQRVAYHSAPEALQTQANYVEVPAYVTPTGKAYVQQYQPPVAYVAYAQPTLAPAQATVTPVVYQMPVVQYPTALMAPPVLSKGYYQQYTETNSVDDVQDEVESPKQYVTQTEVPYSKPSAPEFPRYYNSRTPIREENRHSSVSELPPPNPLLLKGTPSHLSHLPKALPMFSRPLTKPVYSAGSNFISSAYSPKPSEQYGTPFKRRPSSLLDSYIPSGLQVEYLKKGYVKDPLAAYEALSSSRQLHFIPRQYERGFLPNQMYHTAAGGITYGHYKRTPKEEKIAKKK